jgi:hypothetical protein
MPILFDSKTESPRLEMALAAYFASDRRPGRWCTRGWWLALIICETSGQSPREQSVPQYQDPWATRGSLGLGNSLTTFLVDESWDHSDG